MKKLIVLLCLIAPFLGIFGQKVQMISGDFSLLKPEKIFGLQFSYDSLIVGQLTEQDYINKKVMEYNSVEAGKGEKWKEIWLSNRKTKYQPKFDAVFNKYLKQVGKSAIEGADAKYTIKVRTILIESGYDIAVFSKPAFINVIIDIVETNNPINCIASFKLDKISSPSVQGAEFDNGWRISDCYSKSAVVFGTYFSRKIKQK